MLVRRTWHGDEIIARARRASARAAIGMAEEASVEMKTVAHVISGDLKRSIHAAEVDTMGELPSDDPAMLERSARMAIEVGSWLPYACVENNRGGTHRFADIGWELARPTFWPKLKRAWKEEGL